MDHDEFNQRHTFDFDYSNIDRVSEIKQGIYFIETHASQRNKQELRPAKKRNWKQSDITVRGRGWLSCGSPWEVNVLKKGKDRQGRPFTRVSFKTWGQYLAHPPNPYKDKTGSCKAFMTLLYHEDIVAWELRPVWGPGTKVEAYQIVVPNIGSDSPEGGEREEENEGDHDDRETIGLFSELKEIEKGTFAPALGPFRFPRQFRSWRLRPVLPQDKGLFMENVHKPTMNVSPLVYGLILFLIGLIYALGLVRLVFRLIILASLLCL